LCFVYFIAFVVIFDLLPAFFDARASGPARCLDLALHVIEAR
jgi:hypothetical protein